MTTKTAREKLKEVYDVFVEKFGRMNSPKNKRIICLHPQGFKTLASVEVKIDNTYRESDILTRSAKGQEEVYRTENPHDALSFCLGMYGRVDLSVMSDITDKEPQELLNELGDLIYLNPDTDTWETADRYLSNNVYKKMLQARYAVEQHPDNEQYKRSLDAITEVQPQMIPWDLLSDSINLGERWCPVSLFSRFATSLFNDVPTNVYLFPTSDKFKVEISNRWQSPKASRELHVQCNNGSYRNRARMYGDDLMAYALENVSPVITYTDGLGNKVTDTDATQLANDKIESIRQEWGMWLQVLPQEDKDMLVETYNNLYNCYVIRKYNGSHMRFPGLDMERLGQVFGITKLHDSQRDTAWRIIQDAGAIVDHSVGTGKTMVMVLAAHEMKRMKIRNKPAILCLKANVGDVVKTYRTAYPQARVLAPGEQDFEKANRKRLFHEMKNNDWDCVIMTHDQFGKIPQSDELQKEILQEELDNLEKDLIAVKDAGHNVSRSMLKGLQQRKETLGVKLQVIRHRMEAGKDDGIDFEQMGIDHLFIDESHRFKNLNFSTRHDRVAGLGNTQGSQKALNMLFAIRTLQKRFGADLQATFLSGTPISNSLTEMYLLFKYLRPRELERQNIRNFDSWAAVFAKKSVDYEFSVTNQIQAKERFRHFIKVPELALFYNEIADYRTNKSINIDKPETVEELVHLPPTKDQTAFIQDLINYAKTGEGVYIGRDDLVPGCPQDTARMLIATNYAKKMSTDMRLINEYLYEDHPGNKISVCCKNVSEFYHRFKEHKGTQIIFCDLGVPDKKKWNVYDEIKKKLIEEYHIPVAEIAFIHSYNEKTRGKLFKQINNGEVRILAASTDKGGTGTNVQERVVAIHDLDIPWKPAELEQRGGRGARQGNWLAKLHQENLVYRYIYAVEKSLDTYKFTLLKNKQTFIAQMKNNELQVRSIDEGSFDESTGMNFAEYVAILSGDTTLLEKAKIDKKLAVLENLRTAYYREQHNNKYLLEHKITRKEDVDQITTSLQRDNDQYTSLLQRDEVTQVRENPLILYALTEQREQMEVERKKFYEEKERLKREKWLKRMDALVSKRAKQEGYKTEVIEEVPEEEPVEKEEMSPVEEDAVFVGKFLIQLWKNWKPQVGEVSECIGSLYGFNCYIERTQREEQYSSLTGSNIPMFSNQLFIRHKDGGIKYMFNHGLPSRDNLKLASKNYLHALDKCEGLLHQYKEEQERLERDIISLQSLDVKPFSRDNELVELRSESKRLDKVISENIAKGNSVPVAEKEEV